MEEISEEDRKKALLALINSPFIFCKSLLGLTPFPYQKKFIEDKSKRIVACAGRQVGKSVITSARALWFAVTHPSTTTLIVSSSMRQSMLMFDKISKFVEGSEILQASIINKTRTKLEFTNNSQIVALPCGRDGYSLRGYTAHQIIIDEAAFVPEDVITKVAMPMLATTGGTMIMLSTPLDRTHYFYKAFTSPDWSKYQFKTSDSPLVTKEFLEQQKLEIGERQYNQEYNAEFVDEDSTYFSNELIRSCIHTCSSVSCEYCDILSGARQPSGYLFAGYDPGGMSDPAALAVVERVMDDQKTMSYRVVLARTFLAAKGAKELDAYSRITGQVAQLHERMHFKKLLVDSTGLGSPIVETCKSLKLPADGYKFSQQTKQELLSNLLLSFEKKRITIPDDLNLISNLNCITAERNAFSGTLSFDHPSGTHDDLAYALAMAIWAARFVPTVVMMRQDLPKNEDLTPMERMMGKQAPWER